MEICKLKYNKKLIYQIKYMDIIYIYFAMLDHFLYKLYYHTLNYLL